jgi:hypothetical protein
VVSLWNLSSSVLICILCIVVYRTDPLLLSVPSTFLTGSGLTRVLRVSLFCQAKSSSIIIPSAPLSSRACALISRPDFFPTRVTLSTMEGDRLFHIVSPGTGSESIVSSRENLFTKHELDNCNVLSDSAAVGQSKNPQKLEPSGDME